MCLKISMKKPQHWRVRFVYGLGVLLLLLNSFLVNSLAAQELPVSGGVAQTPVLSDEQDTAGAPVTQIPAGNYLANKTTPTIGSGQHLLNVTLGLAAIVALIFAMSWLVRRFSQGAFAGNQHLKIIAALPLGTRERLLMVDAAGQTILLGVTATQITALHVFDEPVSGKTTAGDVGAGAGDFSQKLLALLQQTPPTADQPSKPSSPQGPQ